MQKAAIIIQEAPTALELLKDWSVWLAGIQTGALGLVSFVAGQSGVLNFRTTTGRFLVYVAVLCFAGSVISAAFLLVQIPWIRSRMDLDPNAELYVSPDVNIYDVGMISVLTNVEHWLFVVGIGLFCIIIWLEMWETGTILKGQTDHSRTSSEDSISQLERLANLRDRGLSPTRSLTT